MNRTKKSEIQSFVSNQIAKGHFSEIAVPEPRGTNHWILIDQQHSKERSRERDLEILIPKSQYVVSVLNPTSGMIAAISVEPPQPSLLDDDFSSNDSAPSHEVARRTTRYIQTTKELDHHVLMALNADTSVVFSDLIEIAGSENELKGSLKRLRRFENQGMNVQTIDQIVTIEPGKILAKSVPTGNKEQVTLTYMGLEPSSRGELMLTLQLQAYSEANSSSLSSQIVRQRARLNTINNHRTLKLLQAAQLMDIGVQAEVDKEFDLRTRKWVCVVLGLTNEANLLERMGAVGAYIIENY